jgi:hypothetical protein
MSDETESITSLEFGVIQDHSEDEADGIEDGFEDPDDAEMLTDRQYTYFHKQQRSRVSATQRAIPEMARDQLKRKGPRGRTRWTWALCLLGYGAPALCVSLRCLHGP